MVFGNLQSKRQELHHVGVINLHELIEFGGKDQRGRMAEIYKTKIPAGTDFAVQHGRNFTRIVVRIASQSIPGSHGLCQPEINLFEKTRGGLSAVIKFREHECMKRVMYG